MQISSHPSAVGCRCTRPSNHFALQGTSCFGTPPCPIFAIKNQRCTSRYRHAHADGATHDMLVDRGITIPVCRCWHSFLARPMAKTSCWRPFRCVVIDGRVSGHQPIGAQYACLMISAGEPGNAKKIQTSVAAGRKVFRILRVCLVWVVGAPLPHGLSNTAAGGAYAHPDRPHHQ